MSIKKELLPIDEDYKFTDLNRLSTSHSKSPLMDKLIKQNSIDLGKDLHNTSVDFQTYHATPSERNCILLFLLCSVLFGIAGFQIKYLAINFPHDFNNNGFMLWRSVSIFIISYVMAKKNGDRIIPPQYVRNRFWFSVRTFGNYISFIFYINCLLELRAATASCFTSMYPLLVLIFSIFILKEKFYTRYLVGLAICLVGALMIVTNDKKLSENGKDILISHEDSDIVEIVNRDSGRFITGVCYGLAHLVSIALVVIGAKVISVENLNTNEQCFYIGLTNGLAGLTVSCFLPYGLGFNPIYLAFCFMNGGIFYLATMCLTKSLKGIALNKVTPLSYFTTLTIFTLGVLVFGEPCYFTDIIGSLMIVIFNAFNSMFPVK
jgi:drug/metabolite transporter (DMT)-like permease